ncbi:MAG: class I SAM-dependent DNA methyltransferase [Planctomycetaceae bacterium]|nr:class I SAM-dependent DNA methyltransferase [Planctomycetaceae bacterium]
MTPAEFIERWSKSGGAEMANSQLFLGELCDLLSLDHPDPTQPDEALNVYTFEKHVDVSNGDGTFTTGRLDLYRRGCFVLESKQGTEKREAEQDELLATKSKKKKVRQGHAKRGTSQWTLVMQRARKQAERYAQAIPGEWPPFLIVVDVGFCFQLFADFSQSGKNYQPFPDPASFQIRLQDLEREDVRERLRTIWLEPTSLDPSRLSAKVTRELAERLAKLAKSMEGKHDPATVASFLMRCLFTMFVEDMEIGGFKSGDFTQLLKDCRDNVANFVPMMQGLWEDMNTGKGLSGWIRRKVMQFNGGLFEDVTALPVSLDQLELLIESAEAKWNDVEPAIFGTLLERALDPVERHKLGAHYTPRAYVERLVMPTIIEPLREEWDTVYATATALVEADKKSDAIEAVRNFHQKLCDTTVLDPACGSGNFLYVSLELMKRLEGEVLNALKDLGDRQQVLITIDPHQFLGIEVNPRAAAITDLVLWIGYLQWHIRTRGKEPIKEPIIRKFHNVECRDAVLAWDAIEDVFDDAGQPVTRWDGRTTKPHPVTCEEVPDETARVQEKRYINPRKAEWPQADYIVGNPPFIGTAMMRNALGDGYTKTIRQTYRELPESCDYVMYWWHNAAEIVRDSKAKQFGFIATNSLRQTFNRRVVEPHLKAKNPLSLVFAVPDHPWVDSAVGAAVRISMTVGIAGQVNGDLCEVIEEVEHGEAGAKVELNHLEGVILSNLRIGADVGSAESLLANSVLSNRGMQLIGAGFIVSRDDASKLGLGRNPSVASVIREYRNGRDLTSSPRDVLVIDLFGLSANEVRQQFPEIFQWVMERVKPERDQNNRASYRDNWWIFGEPRKAFRPALVGLSRYIATVETSKHRFFVFLDKSILPDNKLVNIALDDACDLGVLSSRIHVTWALAAGSRLGVGNDPVYVKTACFEQFPFPDPDEATKQRIRDLGEQLDAHRKRQQELHAELTMTGMYNVLEKLRSGEALTKKEQTIHEQGLVSVLKQIHDDLDAAVFDAYGWPHDLSDEDILQRLVDLNHERAAEEAQGKIRWLRPEFQNPDGEQKTQKPLLDATAAKAPKTTPAKATTTTKQPWPKTLPERIQSVREALTTLGTPATAKDLATQFKGARATTVEELLETLVTVGQANVTDDGRYVG